jgi:hypothetical protein
MSDFNDSTPVATPDQYRSALLAARQKMTDVQLKLLQAHCKSENHSTSTEQLADSLKLPNPSAVKTAYGNYAHLIADALKFTPKLVGKKPMWLHTLAYGVPDANGKIDGEYEWIMRPELVEALQAMKWA